MRLCTFAFPFVSFPSIAAFDAFAAFAAAVPFGVVVPRHHVLELGPQRLDRGELVADLGAVIVSRPVKPSHPTESVRPAGWLTQIPCLKVVVDLEKGGAGQGGTENRKKNNGEENRENNEQEKD